MDRTKQAAAYANSPGVKYDAGKPRMELLQFRALEEVARVATYGATKYEAHNWRNGMPWARLIGASLRHTTAWMCGQDRDPETGCQHLAHAAWCLLSIVEFAMQPEFYHHFDDRFVMPTNKKARLVRASKRIK